MTLVIPPVRRLVVVGGGYIGCEQASIFNNFGTEVHLIVRQVQPEGSSWMSKLLVPLNSNFGN